MKTFTLIACIVVVILLSTAGLVHCSVVEFDDESSQLLLGIQIPGPIYAGGISYLSSTNKIYITGSLYEENNEDVGDDFISSSNNSSNVESSKCFLIEISLSSSDSTTVVTGINKFIPTGGGQQDVPIACSSLELFANDGDTSNNKAIVIGNTEYYGGLNTARLTNNNSTTVDATTKLKYGVAIEIMLEGDSGMTGARDYLIGGDDIVTYPISITSKDGSLYIVSLASRDDTKTTHNSFIDEQEYPNLISGGLRPFGSNYYLRFTKINTNAKDEVQQQDLITEQTLATSDSSSVYPSGIIVVGEFVVIVGNTRGSAGDFPTKETSSLDGSLDGFILKFGNALGNLGDDQPVLVSSTFIDTETSQDDDTEIVTQVCADPMDNNTFYVVGSYSSRSSSPNSVSAFVAKMSINTLKPEWTTRIDSQKQNSSSTNGSGGSTAYDCIVDGNQLYVAGVVDYGYTLDSPDNGLQTAYGMDDIFIAKVETSSGDLFWVRQFGSSMNDRLGRGGCIDLDRFGNVLLLGETEGRLYEAEDASNQRKRKLQSSDAGVVTTDLIVLSVSPNGDFRRPTTEFKEEELEAAPGDVHDDSELLIDYSARSRKADPAWLCVFYFLGVLYMFAAIAIVCDDYFIPALEEIASNRHLDLSMDVAGATLMAAGGSAPELFTNIFGTFVQRSEIGIGTIVGSAAFNVLFVIAMCALCSNDVLELTWWPLFRDSFFYGLGLVVLGIFVGQIAIPGEIELWEALVLFGMYILYVVIMGFNRQIYKLLTGKELPVRPEEIAHSDEEECIETSGKGGTFYSIFLDSSSCGDGVFASVKYILSLPIFCVLRLTVPDVRRPGKHKYCYISFLASIFWIGIFSYFMVDWAEIIGHTIGIPSYIMGLTLLAAGTSVPELITSVIVARTGEGDMALSSSIGSNIFDIHVGLALPWVLYIAINQSPIVIEFENLWVHIFTLLIMLIFVAGATHWQGWKLTKTLAVLMLVFYFGFLAMAIWLEGPCETC